MHFKQQCERWTTVNGQRLLVVCKHFTSFFYDHFEIDKNRNGYDGCSTSNLWKQALHHRILWHLTHHASRLELLIVSPAQDAISYTLEKARGDWWIVLSSTFLPSAWSISPFQWWVTSSAIDVTIMASLIALLVVAMWGDIERQHSSAFWELCNPMEWMSYFDNTYYQPFQRPTGSPPPHSEVLCLHSRGRTLQVLPQFYCTLTSHFKKNTGTATQSWKFPFSQSYGSKATHKVMIQVQVKSFGHLFRLDKLV